MKRLQEAKKDKNVATYVIVLSQIHSNHVAQRKSKLKEQNRRVTLQTKPITGYVLPSAWWVNAQGLSVGLHTT